MNDPPTRRTLDGSHGPGPRMPAFLPRRPAGRILPDAGTWPHGFDLGDAGFGILIAAPLLAAALVRLGLGACHPGPGRLLAFAAPVLVALATVALVLHGLRAREASASPDVTEGTIAIRPLRPSP